MFYSILCILWLWLQAHFPLKLMQIGFPATLLRVSPHTNSIIISKDSVANQRSDDTQWRRREFLQCGDSNVGQRGLRDTHNIKAHSQEKGKTWYSVNVISIAVIVSLFKSNVNTSDWGFLTLLAGRDNDGKKMHCGPKRNIESVALPPKPASATICVLPLSDFIYNLRSSSSSCSPHGWVQTPKNSFPPSWAVLASNPLLSHPRLQWNYCLSNRVV